ncbi:MAG TPA: helix-turn-helix domain-containing protein [Polyangiaceae bacterium]|nr:helix-turn-helix domain-containing protein [Polyangiaceae bacterium]
MTDPPPRRRSSRARAAGVADEAPAPCMLTSGDLMRFMDVDRKTVHNWIRLQHLSGLRTPGGQMRFLRAEVVRFMRRCSFPVPARLGGAIARVACVGVGLAGAAGGPAGATVREHFELLFDAALAAADGGYDLLAVDLDVAPLDPALDLICALRRRPLTRPLPVVGVSASAEARERFVLAGGDAAVASPEALDRVLAFFLGE